MAVVTSDSTDTELAEAFARAYRCVDADVLRSVLAPDVRVRVLSPPGFRELDGVEGMIEELAEFFSCWQATAAPPAQVELLRANRLRTGRLVRVVHDTALRSIDNGSIATMQVTHLLAIDDGRIVLVDELCSGVMPLER